jgi:hypothetical protein
VSPFSIIHYDADQSTFKAQIKEGGQIDEISVRLTDSENRLVDFNGIDNEISIKFEVIKKINHEEHELMKRDPYKQDRTLFPKNRAPPTKDSSQMAQCWFKEPHYLSATTLSGLATAVDEAGGYEFEFQNTGEASTAAAAYLAAAAQKWLICEVVDDYSIVVMRKADGASASNTAGIGDVTANTD